jgi:peptide-methionine (S)-S-oxide reductase
MELATLGGGCFWCLEAAFIRLRGVHAVKSGYAGGHVPNPTYEQVCTKRTGHIEVVQVSFDPAEVSYETLLEVFFGIHDPTQADGQGGDIGPQYLSAIFTHDATQDATARRVLTQLTEGRVFDAPIVTQLRSLETFWPAERYHDRYFDRNPMQPYCAAVIAPKVAKLRAKHADKLRAE